VLSITSEAIRSSGLVAPRPADFQSVNLHVRHARFTARVVQVRGAETLERLDRFVLGVRHQLAQRFAQTGG
jgi:hypothetical protein